MKAVIYKNETKKANNNIVKQTLFREGDREKKVKVI